MKILKKAGAVLLALAMIAVMIPQLGSKVVKAGTPSSTDTWNASDKNTSDTTTTSETGVIKALGKVSGKTVTDNDGTKYTQALKTGTTSYFEINVPQNKFAKITVVAVVNKSDGDMSAIEIENDTTTRKFIRAQSTDKPDIVTLTGYLEGGTETTGKTYNLKHVQNQLFVYKVVADIYDNVESIPQDPVVHKVKLLGTIKSAISLDKGKIKFGLYETSLSSKEGTTDEYTYEIADVESDGSVYPVSIAVDEITTGLKNIDPTSYDAKNGNKVTVNYTDGSDSTEMNFTLKYTDLDGLVWDFTDKTRNWQAITYNGTGTYKNLNITAAGKFEVQPGNSRVQINKGTKVQIPVSGSGKIVCTFTTSSSKGGLNASTLGTVTGDASATTLTCNYKDVEYVELSIGNEGVYLQKIEVTPDQVSQLGASVRQETEAWGNGIRFGGQLNLKKVDKTCESGTLIGLKSTVGSNEMTIDAVGSTCINVERTTYIEETDSLLTYAAALIKIPDDQLNTEIVARPYVKATDGTVYYGEQITTSHATATATLAANK